MIICNLLDQLIPLADRSNTSQVTHVEDRPGRDKRYAIVATKISRDLSWEPNETFESGIRKTVLWYLDNQERFAAVTK